MTTIYKNDENRTITLDLPVEPVGDVVVSVRYQNNLIFEDIVDSLSFTLPFGLTQTDRELEVTWSFSYNEGVTTVPFETTSIVHVVTPILPISKIKEIMGPVAKTDEDIYEIEKAVRHIIQAHTGQAFGKFVGKFSVTGSGGTSLRLPFKANKIRSINNHTYWADGIALRGGGWYLVSRMNGVPTVRADFDGWNEATNTFPTRAPYKNRAFAFTKHTEFVIDGDFGWNEVPGQVQEAAKLLINDYACGESMYRDRYIQAMQTSDWRIQFNSGAYDHTGNVRADQLLEDFIVKREWMVL